MRLTGSSREELKFYLYTQVFGWVWGKQTLNFRMK